MGFDINGSSKQQKTCSESVEFFPVSKQNENKDKSFRRAFIVLYIIVSFFSGIGIGVFLEGNKYFSFGNDKQTKGAFQYNRLEETVHSGYQEPEDHAHIPPHQALKDEDNTALLVSDNIDVLFKKVERQEEAINRLTACLTPKVTFTAELADKVTKVKGNTVLKYADVKENINGDYNQWTGEFTVRQPGLYLFQLHALGSWEKEARLMIVKNGKRLAGLFVQGGEGNGKVNMDNGHNAASTSAIVDLIVGDKVKVVGQYTGATLYQAKAEVQGRLTPQQGLYQDYYPKGFGGNSFSGVLLRSSRCPN